MKSIVRLLPLLLVLTQAGAVPVASALAQGPVVRAVLFYTPTCPHCHDVLNDHLPPIFDRYGGRPRLTFDESVPRDEVAFYIVSNGQLEILLIDASRRAGQQLYQSSTRSFQVPRNRQGVPRLIIEETVLVGSFEIPNTLPEVIERGLAGDGIDWPEIAGLSEAVAAIPGQQPLAATEPEPADTLETVAGADAGADAGEDGDGDGDGARIDSTPEPVPDTYATPVAEAEEPDTLAETEADVPVTEAEEEGEPADSAGAFEILPEHRPSMIELYRRDPVGNSLSVLVLIAMLLSLAAVVVMWRTPGSDRQLGVAVPVIALLGIVVAAYLTYIESSGAEAVCGPVGDCNAVQSSEYAFLFGLIPIGAMGLAGYVAIIAAWLISSLKSGAASDLAKLALLAMTALGTLFSVYLTFLEPFVIGATCAWCLTSAVAITLLMWLSARPGIEAWARVRAHHGVQRNLDGDES